MKPEPYYEEDGIQIFHGDCREILPYVGKFDLCLTDPPYGIGETNSRALSRENLAPATNYGEFGWDSEPVSLQLLTHAQHISNKSIIWGGNYYDLPKTKSWLVWDKLNGENDFADCELAWSDLGCAVRIFRFMWNGMLRDGESRGAPRVHPTQKPVELILWCIEKAKNPQTILDPFMGSGTTLVAAKKLNRRAVGIEREEKYCEIAVKRLKNTTPNLFAEQKPPEKLAQPLDIR